MENNINLEIVELKGGKHYILYFTLYLTLFPVLIFLPRTTLFDFIRVAYIVFLILYYKNKKKYDQAGNAILDLEERSINIKGEKYFLADLDFFEINIDGYANQAIMRGKFLALTSGLTNTIEFSYKGEKHIYNFRIKNKKEYLVIKSLLKH